MWKPDEAERNLQCMHRRRESVCSLPKNVRSSTIQPFSKREGREIREICIWGKDATKDGKRGKGDGK
jgi:hypothetical protein